MADDIHYIGSQECKNTPWTSHSLSALISSILEPISPVEGIDQCLSLAHLLLLSNNLTQANKLLTAIFAHGPTIILSSRDTETKVRPSLALEAFWLAHTDTLPRPPTAPVIHTSSPLSPQETLSNARWDNFRNSTRTSYMYSRLNILPIQDVHSWRSSDDPRILAMCCRLLAKCQVEGEYVSHGRMREALEVAKKLYAVPEETGVLHWSQEEILRKHSAKLFRHLPLELAIRVGELEVATEILSDALTKDGLGEGKGFGGSLEEFLMVEGVWDVLPLLNKEGVKGNPYFIDESVADEMVGDLVYALELRAKEGRQWSLDPAKVTWKELLERLARGAWKVNKKEYRKNGAISWRDILNEPASQEDIQEAEEKFGELPMDFKEMCKVSNGFKGGWNFLTGGISGINDMNPEIGSTELDLHESDFEPHEIEAPEEIAGQQYMIMLASGVDCDGFEHWIIPPKLWKAIVKEEVEDGAYKYWHTCHWAGEIYHYDSMWDWVAELLEKVEGMVERGEHNDDNGASTVAEDSEDEESEEETEAEDKDD